MEITLGHSTLLFAASAAIAGGVSYWMYRRTTPQLSGFRKTILASLRFLALTLILFLLARPILARLLETRVEPVLAILLDSSQSIGLGTEAGDSAAAARIVSEAYRVIQSDGSGEVEVFGFDSDVRPIAGDSIMTEVFDGQRTDIASAIQWIEDSYVNSNLGAILVVSDGRYNSGRNPVHTAEKSRVPIYTVAIGDSTERRDVRVSALNTNELTYSGVQVPVQVSISAIGYEGRRVTVSLSADGSLVDSEPIDLAPDQVERTVELSFVPDRPGLFTVEARVSPLDGEITTRNNVASTAIRVLDSRRKVLLLGAAPDPDVSALFQTISSSKETEVTRIVQQRGGGFYGSAFPEDLTAYDAIILVGYPGSGTTLAHLQKIAEAAAEGTPVLFTLTRSTDLRLFNLHLASVVGVSFSTPRRGFFEASIVLTPAGRRHPAFEGVSREEVLSKLPPLTANESNWTAAADAVVLATTRARGVNLGDPAIVIRRSGPYRSAAILGAGHWRLTNLPEDLSAYDDYWPTVLTNFVQWLSATRDDRPVRVRATRDQYAGDERVELVGQVYDESLNPVTDAEVDVVVTSPAGNEFRYLMKPIGNGRYSFDLAPPGEGTYQFSARASRNGVSLGDDTGSFAVGNLTLEFRNTSADPVLMRQIAHRSGGRQITEDAIDDLPGLLQGQESFVARASVVRQETELWRQFIFAGIIVALLTTEWVLRKRSGLS